MKYGDKTKEQPINELAKLHQRIEDLEAEATERKQLEAEIQDAREYAENIVETVREPLVVLNSDLKILTANHSFYDTFKVTPEETIGNFIYDLGNRQWDIPKLRVLFEKILSHDTVFNGYEVEHDFLDIGRKIILLNARQIFRKNIGSHIILLAMEDITERREIENGLEKARNELEVIKISEDEAREYAESIINTVREPLIALDQDLRVVTASRSFYEVFKVTPKETVGQLIYDLGNKQWNIPKLRELLETILPQKTTFDNYEVEHEFSTIGRRIMLLNARQIKRVSGKERIILLAIENITERKRLEDLLTESEERYRRLFETADDGILLLEKREGNITHANPAITKMLGYTKEECIGKKLKNIGFSLAVDDFKKIMQELDKNGIIYYDDVPVQTKVGQTFYADIYMVNRARLVQCNIRDVTERKKAEESLREALKEVKQLKNHLHEENIYLKEEINLLHSHEDIVGNSEAIKTVLMQIEQVAPTDSTVLILGETGTGKELLAHAIHDLSSRKGRLMIKVNCAALPPTLIESELFGREKGAFTGALSKQLGRFELADASTIFLDDINTLPLELQAKLLRVLESGEFERLGSPRTVKVDVRIISATNRDLAMLVSKGRFREDLYYRLNVFQITVPPLRERREDILPLVWSFVQDFSKRMGKRIESIPQKGIEALQAYPWPGNVRELRNVTERAMIITTGPVLHLDAPKIAESGANQSWTLEEVEKRHIIKALNTTGWRVSGKDGAAEILGINPKTLESRMQRLGIERSKKNS